MRKSELLIENSRLLTENHSLTRQIASVREQLADTESGERGYLDRLEQLQREFAEARTRAENGQEHVAKLEGLNAALEDKVRRLEEDVANADEAAQSAAESEQECAEAMRELTRSTDMAREVEMAGFTSMRDELTRLRAERQQETDFVRSLKEAARAALNCTGTPATALGHLKAIPDIDTLLY